MPRVPRSEVIDPAEITVVHAISRTVRKCFLLGDDPVGGKNFDHRKVWIEEMLEHFAACFGIDLLCYSILSNHYHLILRTRPDVVQLWSDTEVARRWLKICPLRHCHGEVPEPTEAELNSIRKCPVKLAEIRARLSSVSWWMRLLNQRVAQKANNEEEMSGHFWQGRYRAIRLIDEESLLACAAYVELNPIRAAQAETLEESEFTSVKRRIEAEFETRGGNRDSFLAKLDMEESTAPIGPNPAKGKRCSDKGFLPMGTLEYFELLDWTARQLAPGKQGTTPSSLPPILSRLAISSSRWVDLVNEFEEAFYHVAGRCDRVSWLRSNLTRHPFRMNHRAQKLLPANS